MIPLKRTKIVVGFLAGVAVLAYLKTGSGKVEFNDTRIAQTRPFYICTNSTQHSGSEFISGIKSPANDNCVSLSCDTCAIVTGSGHLLGSGLGYEIDSNHCVIRTNDAHILGYESDVGIRTTIRMVDDRSLGFFIKGYLKNERSFGDFSKSIVVRHASNNPQVLQMVQNFIPKIQANIYEMTTDQIVEVKKYFEKLVLNSSKLEPSTWVSGGFKTLYMAHEFCGEIHVYGISPADHCYKQAFFSNIPYHYYNNYPWPFYFSECTIFNWNWAKKTSKHFFYEEKMAYANIQKDWKNLYFHAPEWKTNP